MTDDYQSVPPRIVGRVRVRYRFIGRAKPLPYHLEDDVSEPLDLEKIKKSLEDYENYGTPLKSSYHMRTLLREVEELRAALAPLARVVPWLPDDTENDVYLGTQLRGVDNDSTPTIGECRHAYAMLAALIPPSPPSP